jgi:osmotically inducible protein OsmC
MTAVRRATATWQGDLTSGSGTVSAGSSDKFKDLATTWASRIEDPNGRTSPEELLAAAHASCFSMAFSNNLAKAGFPPERVEVTSEVTLEKLEAGQTVTSSALTVRAKVPGITEEAFQAAAQAAKAGCPISRALSDSVALSMDATLES